MAHSDRYRTSAYLKAMANEKEQKPKTKKPAEQKPKAQAPKQPPPEKKQEKGVLQTTAEAIGSTIGTLAVKTGIVHPPKAQKPGKLPKKNKARLPRKLKKQALKKKLK